MMASDTAVLSSSTVSLNGSSSVTRKLKTSFSRERIFDFVVHTQQFSSIFFGYNTNSFCFIYFLLFIGKFKGGWRPNAKKKVIERGKAWFEVQYVTSGFK